MLYREIIAVCSEIHTKHINTVWAERRIVERYNGGTYGDHWNAKDNHTSDYGPARCTAVHFDRCRRFGEACRRHLRRP